MIEPTPPHDAIAATIAAYCQLCDDGRFDEWAQLFTDDARFVVMGRTHEGRAAIQAFIEAGQPPERRGRHATFNSLVRLDSAEGARAWTDYLFMDRERSVTSVGRYHDELVPGPDGRWRFALREIVFMGDEPVVTTLPTWD